MTTTNDCDIIRDLLPLYAEQVVSDNTRIFVEEHLDQCTACQKELSSLTQTITIPAEQNLQPLQNFQRSWKHKKLKIVLTTTAVLFFCFFSSICLYLLELPCYSDDVEINTEYILNYQGIPLFFVSTPNKNVMFMEQPIVTGPYFTSYKVVKMTPIRQLFAAYNFKNQTITSVGCLADWKREKKMTDSNDYIISLEFTDRTVQYVNGELQE